MEGDFSIKNFRDDTIQEDLDEGDYEQASKKAAKKVGIDINKIEIIYIEYKDKNGFNTHHKKNGETKIVTTKKGIEDLNEKNSDNLINSMVHEKEHVNDNSLKYKNLSKNGTSQKLKIKANAELKAIEAQRNHKSWQKTTSTYKVKIKRYENVIKKNLQYYNQN